MRRPSQSRIMQKIALALAFLSLAAAASAAEIGKLKKAGKTEKEMAVNGVVSMKDTCESRGLPEIDLDIPPKGGGGTVCVRPGMVRLGETWSGRNQHCIGKRISGVFVIYKSFANFTGVDTMQYAARTSSDSKTYEIEIRIEGGPTALHPGSEGSNPQVAGPMPLCRALVL
jgi:hypothetical protein